MFHVITETGGIASTSLSLDAAEKNVDKMNDRATELGLDVVYKVEKVEKIER